MEMPVDKRAVLRRRARHQQRWAMAIVATLGIGVLVVGLMWLGALKRPEWTSALGNFQTATKSHKGGPGGGLGARDCAELGLSWLGDGQVAFGDFSVLTYNTVTRTHYLSEFRLKGQTTCGTEAAFQAFIDGHRRFFREQVAVTIRNCDANDLSREKLDRLEKRIVTHVNRALGCNFLEELDIEEFAVYESVDHGRFVLHEDER